MATKRAPPGNTKRATSALLRQMQRDAPVLAVRFYRTETGNEPVREWLQDLPKAVRHKIGSDVQAVQWRWPVGLPLVDGFGQGLYEVRTAIDGDIYRVLFCNIQATMVLLHGIQKKTGRTPDKDKDLARQRQANAKEGLS